MCFYAKYMFLYKIYVFIQNICFYTEDAIVSDA